MKVGIFGGTFDPPHLGHLIVAQDAWAALRLDRVRFMPAAEPPHKAGRAITPAALRLEMVRAAIAGDERFDVETFELERGGTSYTVDTLRALTAREPATSFVLLIGADQHREFSTWREPAVIGSLATIAVLARDGAIPAGRGEDGSEWVRATRVDISSSDIRRRVAAGMPIRYLVPAAVRALILDHALYGAGAETGHGSDRDRRV